MYCQKYGNAISEENVFCKKCEAEVESQQNKKRKLKMRKILSILTVITLCLTLVGCGTSEDVVDLGETIEIKDVVSIVVDSGQFFDSYVYPSNASDTSSGIIFESDGVMFGFYGKITNISAVKFDVNKIVEANLVINKKYEFNASIWFENEDGTEILGDMLWSDPKAYLTMLENRNYVLIGQIGSEVYNQIEDINLKFKIKKNIDNDDEYKTYIIPLELKN